MPGIRQAIAEDGKILVKNVTTGEVLEAECQLSQRQREIILAGGLLNYTRETAE